MGFMVKIMLRNRPLVKALTGGENSVGNVYERGVDSEDEIEPFLKSLACEFPGEDDDEEFGSTGPWILRYHRREISTQIQETVQPPPQRIVVSETETSDRNKSRINLKDTLMNFISAPYAPVTAEIECEEARGSLGAHVGKGASSSCILVDDGGLEIRIHRTIRLPDDEVLHQLPASFGTFPLKPTAAFASRLPEAIASTGGVFFPMRQREALWLEFNIRNRSMSAGRRYLIRPFVGNVNAITGKRMDAETEVEAQDYVVVPDQRWLDGICVDEGVVRQFVAMPVGSGYTVEGQKTGEERHGGLKLEIIPSYDPAHIELSQQWRFTLPNGQTKLSLHSTPTQFGLREGDEIYLHFSPTLKMRGKRFGDIKKEMEPSVVLEDLDDHLYAVQLLDCDELNDGMLYRESWSDGSKGLYSSISPRCVHAPRRGCSSMGRATPTDVPEMAITPILGVTAPRANLKTMGIAAGGKLVQDIVRDNNPVWQWNTSRGAFLHIHILDPIAYEMVTHTLPPPTPIDAVTYANMGYNFYVVEEDFENRVEGGDFAEIKSISAIDKERLSRTSEGEAIDLFNPVACRGCSIRLCDCVLRPCNHQFCNECVVQDTIFRDNVGNRQCPACSTHVDRVVGFGAPMNLPDEQSIEREVEVHLLKAVDGKVAFDSTYTTTL